LPEAREFAVGPALGAGLGAADEGLVDEVEVQVGDASGDAEVGDGGFVLSRDRAVGGVAGLERSCQYGVDATPVKSDAR
jgi:hypothetical protein